MKSLTDAAVARLTTELSAYPVDVESVLSTIEERANNDESMSVELRGVRDGMGYPVFVAAFGSDFEEA